MKFKVGDKVRVWHHFDYTDEDTEPFEGRTGVIMTNFGSIFDVIFNNHCCVLFCDEELELTACPSMDIVWTKKKQV